MNAVPVLVSSLLAPLPGVAHAFFTRDGGVSHGIYASLNAGLGSGDDPSAVGENRARMAHMLGVTPDHFLSAYQIHSPDVAVVDRPWRPAERPKVDAIVTATPGLAIGASAADCGPVLLVDPVARVIAAAHAGWKGALDGVIEATVATMERHGAVATRILAALGPMIRQPSYEVGADFVARFCAADSANTRFFVTGARAGHSLFDLAGYIRMRLQQAGVRQIDDLGLCTYADARFFSYRRSVHRSEPDYGRHVHAIALTF